MALVLWNYITLNQTRKIVKEYPNDPVFFIETDRGKGGKQHIVLSVSEAEQTVEEITTMLAELRSDQA